MEISLFFEVDKRAGPIFISCQKFLFMHNNNQELNIEEAIMKVDTKLLRELLDAQDQALDNFDTEKLRLILGCFRHYVRLIEKEINQREEGIPTV